MPPAPSRSSTLYLPMVKPRHLPWRNCSAWNWVTRPAATSKDDQFARRRAECRRRRLADERLQALAAGSVRSCESGPEARRSLMAPAWPCLSQGTPLPVAGQDARAGVRGRDRPAEIAMAEITRGREGVARPVPVGEAEGEGKDGPHPGPAASRKKRSPLAAHGAGGRRLRDGWQSTDPHRAYFPILS